MVPRALRPPVPWPSVRTMRSDAITSQRFPPPNVPSRSLRGLRRSPPDRSIAADQWNCYRYGLRDNAGPGCERAMSRRIAETLRPQASKPLAEEQQSSRRRPSRCMVPMNLVDRRKASVRACARTLLPSRRNGGTCDACAGFRSAAPASIQSRTDSPRMDPRAR